MNHDRLSADKKTENTAEGAKLVAYLLRMALDVDVNFNSNMVIDDIDPNMCVILSHGDNPVDKEPADSIALEYGNPNKFTYYVTAHTHGRKQEPKNDRKLFRKETLPAFCPGDAYAKRVALGTAPGIKIAGAQRIGAPITIDIPIFYD